MADSCLADGDTLRSSLSIRPPFVQISLMCREDVVIQLTAQAQLDHICQAQQHPNTALWLAQTLPI
jgi:hypothetical protein